jgi:hypothetical protein
MAPILAGRRNAHEVHHHLMDINRQQRALTFLMIRNMCGMTLAANADGAQLVDAVHGGLAGRLQVEPPGDGQRRVAGPHMDQAQHAVGHAADPRRRRTA